MMLAHEIETAFLIAKPQYSFLSSSVCKEIALNGGDLLKMCIRDRGGTTARRISKFRPSVPVLAVTFTKDIQRKLLSLSLIHILGMM